MCNSNCKPPEPAGDFWKEVWDFDMWWDSMQIEPEDNENGTDV